MKRTFRGFISGFLVCALISGTMTVFANSGLMKEINYGIKVFVDGAEIVPKDGNGNILQPFTMEGSTYLPVRAIADALGTDVKWDGVTKSVYLGKNAKGEPDNYLDKIQYTDFKVALDSHSFYKINGTVTDFLDKTYTNGIILYNTGSFTKLKNDIDKANMTIDYPLNSQYKKLNGKIVLPKAIDSVGLSADSLKNSEAVSVLFYGDGSLLYKATNVTNTMPFTFSIDVSGINCITIKIVNSTDIARTGRYVALTDLALYK